LSAQIARLIALCLAALGLLGCTLTRLIEDAPLQAPLPPSPTAPPAAPSGEWMRLTPALEWRALPLDSASLLVGGRMVVARVDLALAEIRVHYNPGAALTLDEWRARLPQAALIVNGGFFDEQDRALGLLVTDGQALGASFSGFGGMLQVDGAGAARVRSLVGEPYWGEPLWQAVQAFPMLIEAGGVLAPQGAGFDVRSRRTWAGQDRAGRILFGVTTNLISLADLQTWLLASDLDLGIAFGLDGGQSSALDVSSPALEERIPAFDRLPTVIAVYTR